MGCRTPIFTAGYRPAESKATFRWSRRLLDTLECWHQRSRQRAALAELDDRMLKDIGLTRSDVAGEIHKPFWQR